MQLLAQMNLFPADGNTGIGTTTPESLLHIKGNSGLILERPGIGKLNFGLTGLNGMPVFVMSGMDGSLGGMVFQATNSGGYDDLFLKADGKVGIGTNDPQATLHVTGDKGLRIERTGAGSANLFFSTLNSAPAFIIAANATDHAIAFRTRASGDYNDLYISTSGNIGLGTYTTTVNGISYRLAVNGSILAKEVRVRTDWADYVFAKDYKLMSLNELEKYITTHQHLPEVPSATEVETQGIDVGKSNALLMKKVEELTLYIIRLNKKIESLEAQVQQRR